MFYVVGWASNTVRTHTIEEYLMSDYPQPSGNPGDYPAGGGVPADGGAPAPGAGQPAPGAGYPAPGAGQPAPGAGYPAGGGYPAPPREDPGQTMGILALIFAFVAAPVGLILGIVARKKSREAGFDDNQLGKWGFILGLIFTILWVLYIIGMVILLIVAGTASASMSTY